MLTTIAYSSPLLIIQLNYKYNYNYSYYIIWKGSVVVQGVGIVFGGYVWLVCFIRISFKFYHRKPTHALVHVHLCHVICTLLINLFFLIIHCLSICLAMLSLNKCLPKHSSRFSWSEFELLIFNILKNIINKILFQVLLFRFKFKYQLSICISNRQVFEIW